MENATAHEIVTAVASGRTVLVSPETETGAAAETGAGVDARVLAKRPVNYVKCTSSTTCIESYAS
jgi:hypothetical protein